MWFRIKLIALLTWLVALEGTAAHADSVFLTCDVSGVRIDENEKEHKLAPSKVSVEVNTTKKHTSIVIDGPNVYKKSATTGVPEFWSYDNFSTEKVFHIINREGVVKDFVLGSIVDIKINRVTGQILVSSRALTNGYLTEVDYSGFCVKQSKNKF